MMWTVHTPVDYLAIYTGTQITWPSMQVHRLPGHLYRYTDYLAIYTGIQITWDRVQNVGTGI